jgi:hypothetical protein
MRIAEADGHDKSAGNFLSAHKERRTLASIFYRLCQHAQRIIDSASGAIGNMCIPKRDQTAQLQDQDGRAVDQRKLSGSNDGTSLKQPVAR